MSETSQKSKSSGGIGFTGLLFIVFITLKLTGHINWSWWWVFSPFWIPLAIAAIAVFLYGAICMVEKWMEERGRK